MRARRAAPPGVPDAGVSIGPRARALAVYLVVRQHVPVERCRDLIAGVTGAEVSAGARPERVTARMSLANRVPAAASRTSDRSS